MLGDVVRAHRRRLGWSQEDLAHKAGVSVRGIRKIELRQTGTPRPVTVRLLADAFGLQGADRDRFCAAASDQTHASAAAENLPTPPPVEVPAVSVTPETVLIGRPAQLPPAPADLVGRDAELASLDALLPERVAAGPASPAAVVIAAVSGPAGVGKTALAVHWAHRVADQFPDGQLYVNLRGYGPDRSVTAPTQVLENVLQGLQVPARQIPASLDAQTSTYRSLLAGKRVLVVLDNARDAEQVRPLLPATPGCLVLVTSRNQLTSLVAAQGAHPITLDLLTAATSRALLLSRLGSPRLASEPDAVNEIITRCARLPLALTIVAARAAAYPHFPLTDLAAELRQASTSLDMLTGDDATCDVRAVFSWSYHTLTVGAARLFRLFGLHPGPDMSVPATASLTGLPTDQVRPLLAELTRTHLLTEHTPGRYVCHDLLRTYAAERTTAEDPHAHRRTALTGLFDHYLATATAAIDTLHPAEPRHQTSIAPPASPSHPPTGPAAARAWLDAERPNLVAICAHTAGHGWDGHTSNLAATLVRHLYVDGHHTDALAIQNLARRAAHRGGDQTTEGHALIILGTLHWWQGNNRQATTDLERALTLLRHTHDRAGETRALSTLGGVHELTGDYQQATERLQQAMDLSRQAGDPAGETRALVTLSLIHWRRGHNERAVDHAERTLALSQHTGDLACQARALIILGLVHWRQGRYGPATAHHEHALTLCRKTTDRAGEAEALNGLGLVHQHQNQYGPAADHFRQSLALHTHISGRAKQATPMNGLGTALRATGLPQEARAMHQNALAVAVETGYRYEEARAHDGIAATHHTTGDLNHAHRHWRQAVTLYNRMGLPEAEAVKTHLATLEQQT